MSVPVAVGLDGAMVSAVAPAGIEVVDGKVTYPAPGTHLWRFEVRGNDGLYFSGTIEQVVGDAVPHVANVPDSAWRACLADAAGVASAPSEKDLAGVSEVECADKGVQDLTGAELLTSATRINLAGNPLGSLGPILGLPALRDLDLSRTGLRSVSPLAGLSGLTRLVVDGNHLADLSPLARTTAGGSPERSPPPHLDLSAWGRELTTADVAGGVAMAAPTVTTVSAQSVAATAPAVGTVTPDGVSFPRAGKVQWTFSAMDGAFTGVFSTLVTSDALVPGVHAAAGECVSAGNVWVVVERDTGLEEAACATEFSSGLAALKSAGFNVAGSAFVSGINGYPAAPSRTGYWSYWHAAEPAITTSVDGTDETSTWTYDWEYSDEGAATYVPRAGSIEGWRFVQFIPGQSAPAPSWLPLLTFTKKGAPEPTTPPPRKAHDNGASGHCGPEHSASDAVSDRADDIDTGSRPADGAGRSASQAAPRPAQDGCHGMAEPMGGDGHRLLHEVGQQREPAR